MKLQHIQNITTLKQVMTNIKSTQEKLKDKCTFNRMRTILFSKQLSQPITILTIQCYYKTQTSIKKNAPERDQGPLQLQKKSTNKVMEQMKMKVKMKNI